MLGDVLIKEYNLAFIPLEVDVLSLEMEHAAREIFLVNLSRGRCVDRGEARRWSELTFVPCPSSSRSSFSGGRRNLDLLFGSSSSPSSEGLRCHPSHRRKGRCSKGSSCFSSLSRPLSCSSSFDTVRADPMTSAAPHLQPILFHISHSRTNSKPSVKPTPLPLLSLSRPKSTR